MATKGHKEHKGIFDFFETKNGRFSIFYLRLAILVPANGSMTTKYAKYTKEKPISRSPLNSQPFTDPQPSTNPSLDFGSMRNHVEGMRGSTQASGPLGRRTIIRLITSPAVMRVLALLCLILGFAMQGVLDGQTFTHSVLGILCGGIAIGCALAAAREEPAHRWEGWIMAALGLALGIWCLIMLPSAYRFQQQFNSRRERAQFHEGGGGLGHWSQHCDALPI